MLLLLFLSMSLKALSECWFLMSWRGNFPPILSLSKLKFWEWFVQVQPCRGKEQKQPYKLKLSTEAGLETRRQHRQDSWPVMRKRIFHTVWYSAQQLKLRERSRKGNVHGWGITLPEGLLEMMKPCFSGSNWASASWWERVNKFFLCFALVSLWDLYLNEWASSPFCDHLLILPERRVSECQCGCL